MNRRCFRIMPPSVRRDSCLLQSGRAALQSAADAAPIFAIPIT
jgi:hypothetical protein